MPSYQNFLKPTRPDSAYNKAALSAGTTVEMEHTANKSVAKQIAKKHLDESPQYYKYLKRMEQQMDAQPRKKKKK